MAFSVYLVFAVIAAALAAPDYRASNRIVGGTPTTIEEFPYIVSMVYTYPSAGITIQRCVGSLLSSWHVLTSAFCYTGANNDNMRVRAGSTNSLSGGIVVTLAQVIKHPDFASNPRRADIAVSYLSSALGISNVINVLYLPPENTYIPNGHDVEVVSWGFEYIGGPQLEVLKRIILNKVDTDACAATFAGNEEVEISDSVICASAPNRGTCFGDSGAPMVIGQVVVGISSYYDECGSELPDVFTRIDRYTPWILEAAASRGIDGGNVRSKPVRL